MTNSKEYMRDYQKRYREQNLEKCRKLAREYYYSHKKERQMYNKRYAMKPGVAERMAQYHKDLRAKYRKDPINVKKSVLIREWLQEHAMTQTEMAQIIGVSYNTILNYTSSRVKILTSRFLDFPDLRRRLEEVEEEHIG